MHFTPLTLFLTTLSTASAFIESFTVPAMIAPNKPYTITFNTRFDPAYLWTDVAVTWGYNNPPGSINSVGQYPVIYHLPPNPKQAPVKLVVTAPDGIQKFNKQKKIEIVASVFTVASIVGNVGFTSFNVTIDVGDKVSDKLVTSQGFLVEP
ncbi:hypothetical protein COCMIDRAFT_106506 [Bipolaris oryzae ATCC 44560]|uniref:Uncharacterized protein n=1 Tax=Bipolaris oryzae ATCC 44560 TaxID=930090 RepID=W6YPN5_COCMI|nr:uncharacterized protein COCMIDRAFT_106506 [Bipolaris oryzae ATCC 44560]EUC41317.1 hypothetical protein COCMIDRAFT_106506 [Bipolaris oryzae ATCC 44560]